MKRLISLALIASVAVAGYAQGNGPDTRCGGNLHKGQGHRWVLNLTGSESIPGWAKKKHRHALKCARNDGHRKNMKRQWREVRRSLVPANHDTWLRVGRCERPGSGYGGVEWTNRGPTFMGGLGFYFGTWGAWKPASYPANAGDATWRQQMVVANRVAADVGFTAWGCF